MEKYTRPDNQLMSKLEKDVSKKINIIIRMNQEKEAVFSSLKSLIENEVEIIREENIKKILSSISVFEFKAQFPDIDPYYLEKTGVHDLYALRELVKKNYSRIPGIKYRYEFSLKRHIERLEKSIRERSGFSFDIEKKEYRQEKILQALYQIGAYEEYSKKISRILDEWQKDLVQNRAYLVEKIFWNLRWFFKTDEEKEQVLKAKNLYEKFLEEVDIEKIEFEYNSIKEKENLKKIDLWDDFKLDSAKYYALLEKVLGHNISEDILYGDLHSQLVNEVNSLVLNEDNLKVSLRSWQEFAAKFTLKQKKVLIGDEMGLGKTVEALAVMSNLWSEGKKHFLVICPASIIINWFRETEKHSYLKAIKLHGKNRDEATREWLKSGGVAISSYTTVQKLDLPYFWELDLLVLDEAHYVKNATAKRSKFTYDLTENSEYSMYMTGTPIENNLEEMLNLIERLNPDIVKKLSEDPINYIEDIFKDTIAPVYLRRNRKDVLQELPALTQIEEWVEFGSIEKKHYINKLRDNNFMGMRSSGFAGEIRSKSPKINRILELIEEYNERGDKVIIFSFFKGVIRCLEKEIGNICVGTITGDVSRKKRVSILDEFQKTKIKNVLLAQIDAAGVGLNIQHANTVIICEPQLKPSTETQAIARVYRMGQVKNVFVHRILTENSIDERLMEILDIKQYVFDTYAKESVVGNKSLEKEDIKGTKIKEKILEEERRRYKSFL